MFVADEEGLENLPTELAGYMGRLELALELELTPDRRLAQADAAAVLASIERDGFYIQLPPDWNRGA